MKYKVSELIENDGLSALPSLTFRRSAVGRRYASEQPSSTYPHNHEALRSKQTRKLEHNASNTCPPSIQFRRVTCSPPSVMCTPVGVESGCSSFLSRIREFDELRCDTDHYICASPYRKIYGAFQCAGFAVGSVLCLLFSLPAPDLFALGAAMMSFLELLLSWGVSGLKRYKACVFRSEWREKSYEALRRG